MMGARVPRGESWCAFCVVFGVVDVGDVDEQEEEEDGGDGRGCGAMSRDAGKSVRKARICAGRLKDLRNISVFCLLPASLAHIPRFTNRTSSRIHREDIQNGCVRLHAAPGEILTGCAHSSTEESSKGEDVPERVPGRQRYALRSPAPICAASHALWRAALGSWADEMDSLPTARESSHHVGVFGSLTPSLSCGAGGR